MKKKLEINVSKYSLTRVTRVTRVDIFKLLNRLELVIYRLQVKNKFLRPKSLKDLSLSTARLYNKAG